MDSAKSRYQLATWLLCINQPINQWPIPLTLAGNLRLWPHKLDRSALKKCWKNKANMTGGNVANATKTMTHIEHEAMKIYKWTCHGVNFWQVQGTRQPRDEHWNINIVFIVVSCPVQTSCMEIAMFRKNSCRVTVVLQQQAPPMP